MYVIQKIGDCYLYKSHVAVSDWDVVFRSNCSRAEESGHDRFVIQNTPTWRSLKNQKFWHFQFKREMKQKRLFDGIWETDSLSSSGVVPVLVPNCFLLSALQKAEETSEWHLNSDAKAPKLLVLVEKCFRFLRDGTAVVHFDMERFGLVLGPDCTKRTVNSFLHLWRFRTNAFRVLASHRQTEGFHARTRSPTWKTTWSFSTSWETIPEWCCPKWTWVHEHCAAWEGSFLRKIVQGNSDQEVNHHIHWIKHWMIFGFHPHLKEGLWGTHFRHLNQPLFINTLDRFHHICSCTKCIICTWPKPWRCGVVKTEEIFEDYAFVTFPQCRQHTKGSFVYTPNQLSCCSLWWANLWALTAFNMTVRTVGRTCVPLVHLSMSDAESTIRSTQFAFKTVWSCVESTMIWVVRTRFVWLRNIIPIQVDSAAGMNSETEFQLRNK